MKQITKIGILVFGISMLLLNCEKETIETQNYQQLELDGLTHHDIKDHKLGFNIDNLTFNEASNQVKFKKLKSKFEIQEPVFDNQKNKLVSKIKTTFSKSTHTSKDFSNLDPSIDMSVIKKVTTENYISYTMRIEAPINQSNSFFNLVIQESNGVQEMFTV